MPHIILEVSDAMAERVDWRRCLKAVHLELAAKGYGQLKDFKSRIVQTSGWVIADDERPAEVVFATLHTMNPRPQAMLADMAALVHTHLARELPAASDGRWIQCCVRTQSTPPHRYIKTQVCAPEDLAPRADHTAPTTAQLHA